MYVKINIDYTMLVKGRTMYKNRKWERMLQNLFSQNPKTHLLNIEN
jgi:hypothetical protein